MKFSVDGWDPGYGQAFDVDELADTVAQVDATIEVSTANWAPLAPVAGLPTPSAVLFVDGVRRIDARVWIDDGTSGGERAVVGICASYAAGAVCCCGQGAHTLSGEVRRGLFTTAASATHIHTEAAWFTLHRLLGNGPSPTAQALSNALQRALADLELTAAVHARAAAATHGVGEDDLVVVDGPLHGRAQLPRTIGYVKTHHAQYLPADLNAVVAALRTGQHTPVFVIGTGWERYSWYLRLPALAGGPWTGIVRIEAPPLLDLTEVVTLANMTQLLLGRFASVEYKDGRAPQNLFPIAGLERDLRHQLGDAALVYRALRSSSVATR